MKIMIDPGRPPEEIRPAAAGFDGLQRRHPALQGALRPPAAPKLHRCSHLAGVCNKEGRRSRQQEGAVGRADGSEVGHDDDLLVVLVQTVVTLWLPQDSLMPAAPSPLNPSSMYPLSVPLFSVSISLPSCLQFPP